MFAAAAVGKPRSWTAISEAYLRAIEQLDENLVAGVADMGDLQNGEAEHLLIPRLSAKQTSSLVDLHPALDRMMREGDAQAASSLVDDALGIDAEPLIAARTVLRRRRLERRTA